MEQQLPVSSARRKAPNIMVTGTPGVGKSRLCHQISEMTGLQWLEISKIAKEFSCLEDEFDEVYQCPVLDEDKLLDGLEETMCVGGNIVDYHSCEFFPERWFDVVFVLRTDNTLLYDRLVSRGYTGKKLEDNMDCEIFQTVLEEAKSSYKEEIVHELHNNNPEQLEFNAHNICLWIQEWFDHQSPQTQGDNPVQAETGSQMATEPQTA
ncbi:hypothetical protein HHI36_017605 [Cryptolaemus montrouzieri]|uniref:Adenylate kinase isoenzyme 6 homolog n=1 Tax=Cryptolaemus montrouzieri TaxID=559131 RepID=A0ABD2NNH8_9CUCU